MGLLVHEEKYSGNSVQVQLKPTKEVNNRSTERGIECMLIPYERYMR